MSGLSLGTRSISCRDGGTALPLISLPVVFAAGNAVGNADFPTVARHPYFTPAIAGMQAGIRLGAASGCPSIKQPRLRGKDRLFKLRYRRN